jgi:NADH-quinone oxidoreductase subunit N
VHLVLAAAAAADAFKAPTFDLLTFAPEIILVAVLALTLLIDAFTDDAGGLVASLTSIGLLGAIVPVVIMAGTGHAPDVFGSGTYMVDNYALVLKAVFLLSAYLVVLISMNYIGEGDYWESEYYQLILSSVIGMTLMASARDLISMFIALELLSIPAYMLAAWRKRDLKSDEAGMKYYLMGVFASAVMLYGMSLLYGVTGETGLVNIANRLSTGVHSPMVVILAIVFVLVGFGFKVSAVPFHQWAPDVYEGAPTPVTAFFAAAPKVAAMALFIRVTTVSFAPITHDWQQIVIFLSIASMVLAAFAAIGQNNLKRLLAYSSIGHVGFALVGLSSGTETGVEGVAVYMAIYIAMTVGIFACVLALRTENGPVETISELAGLAQKRPFVAAIIAILMFSLIGLPPLAGFFAKWQVFLAAVEQNLFILAVIGVLASAVSAFYYLRIVKVMYFDEPVAQFAAVPGELNVVMAGIGFLIVTYFVTVGSPLTAAARVAAGSLF